MNHPGEIAYLAGIARPDGGAGQQRPARAPGIHGAAWRRWRARTARCSRRLPADGVAVINADDAYAGYWRGVCAPRPVLRLRHRPARGRGRPLRAARFRQRHRACARRKGERGGQPAGGRACTTCAMPWRRPRRPRPPASAWARSRAGSRPFAPVQGRLQRSDGRQRRDRPRRHLQRQSGLGASPRSTCSRARRAENSWCWATWAKSARTARPSMPRSAVTPAPAASTVCTFSGESCAHAAAAFGEGARLYADVDALLAELEPELAARRDRARQGLALHAHGARRAGAHAARTAGAH